MPEHAHTEHSPATLEPPNNTSHIEDPGAHELELDTSDSDDQFEDACSGMENSVLTSPVPITQVEKVEPEATHGEVPESAEKTVDSQPDIRVAKSEELELRLKTVSESPSPTPGGRPVPTTVVEKLDPDTPSHGEVPGTPAHEMRKADAVPDMVLKASPQGSRASSISSVSRSRAGSTPGDRPIPRVKLEKVDSKPRHGEVPGTEAYEKRREDAQPDIIEEVGDVEGTNSSPFHISSEPLPESASPTSQSVRSSIAVSRRPSGEKSTALPDYDEDADGDAGAGFGDDFDDFEDGDGADFGDFDDGFQEPQAVVPPAPQSLPTVTPSFPIPDFGDFESLEDVLAGTEAYMNALFPPAPEDASAPTAAATHENAVFLTQRSASLWSQLVAPPPLQPPDWIRSRIRRLFLVSLGVPVDLDEILPASKQKKLILPSVHLHSSAASPRASLDAKGARPAPSSRLGKTESSSSVDSQGGGARRSAGRRKGPPPPPDLDLVAARQLCLVTDEALHGMTMAELRSHVARLEAMQGTAKEVLEYWKKCTEEKLGDREAFEGVIENLVKHARKTRK